MSAGQEVFQKQAWLYATLAAGTALCAMLGGTVTPRIYSEIIPQGTLTPNGTAFMEPSLVIAHQGGEDTNSVDGQRGSGRDEFLVKVVSQGESFGTAAAIMKQADALLHGQGGSAVSNGGTLIIQNCTRQRSVQYPEIGDDGLRYNHYGGIYAIWGRNP